MRLVLVMSSAVAMPASCTGISEPPQDVDLLIEHDNANFAKVLATLSQLEDGAARELTLRDLHENKVVKVADEITVDISTLAWVVTYAEAAPNIIWEEIEGVRIPFLSLPDLIRSKQT